MIRLETSLRSLASALTLSFVLAGCGRGATPDADGGATPASSAKASDKAPATRVVAVGSAVTEIVYALGAGGELVGTDTSSVYPVEATKLPQVGYQRTLAAEGILALKPALVVASQEAGPPEVLEQLRSAGVRVEIFNAEPTLASARDRVTALGKTLGRDPAPVLAKLDAEISAATTKVKAATSKPKVLVLYARGANALYVFGKKTVADELVREAGAVNAVTAFEGSRPLTAEALVAAAPDVLVVPSRGLESLGGETGVLNVPGAAETPAGKAKRVVAVDDVLLLTFGPRSGQAIDELARKVHPELAADAPKAPVEAPKAP